MANAVRYGGMRTQSRSIKRHSTPSPAFAVVSPLQHTAIRHENIVLMIVILQIVSKAVSSMTEGQFTAEKQYQTSLLLAKELLEKGLLTREEYTVINTILLQKYGPPLGTLFSEIALL